MTKGSPLGVVCANLTNLEGGHLHFTFRLDMTSPSSKAAVVIGQAEESDEEEERVDSNSKEDLQKEEERKAQGTRLGDARAGLAGLRLSSVTATVERTLCSLPSIELPQWTPVSSSAKKSPQGNDGEPQFPSLLHKRLYERNGEVHADLHMFFQVGNWSQRYFSIKDMILGAIP